MSSRLKAKLVLLPLPYCWQCHPVVDPHCRLCQWRTRPWESWRRYRRKRFGFCRRAVTETTSCMILIFWWKISKNSNDLSRWSFTGRGECCSCWNGLKSIHPPRISSISISSLSKQLVFLGIGWLLGCWTLAVSFGVLHHQLLTLRPPWSRGPVKIWSPCVWLSKKHERCDDSRSGIAPLWRWVVEILVNGIGQNWPKQECFI